MAVNGLAGIADLIKNKETIKPVIYQTSQTNPIINLKWIFAILAALLALGRYFRAC
jgi:hypothetical protein